MTAKEEQVAHHLTSSQYSDDNWSINTLDLVSDVGGEKKPKHVTTTPRWMIPYGFQLLPTTNNDEPTHTPNGATMGKSETELLWGRMNLKWPLRKSLQKKSPNKVKTSRIRKQQNRQFTCIKQVPINHQVPEKESSRKSSRLPPANNKSPTAPSKAPSVIYQGGPNKAVNDQECIDIYYFDHGNSAYYRTTDFHPVFKTERCAEKTDLAARRFWAEIFGAIHVGVAFVVTAFTIQLARFLLMSIVRPLTVGMIQLFGDYFLKPLLSIAFNSLIQPIFIFLYNIATSLRDLCEPLATLVGFFVKPLATLLAACRLVEIIKKGPISEHQK